MQTSYKLNLNRQTATFKMNSQIVYVDAWEGKYDLNKAKPEYQWATGNEAMCEKMYLDSDVAAFRDGNTPFVANISEDIIISIIRPKNFTGISFFTNI